MKCNYSFSLPLEPHQYIDGRHLQFLQCIRKLQKYLLPELGKSKSIYYCDVPNLPSRAEVSKELSAVQNCFIYKHS